MIILKGELCDVKFENEYKAWLERHRASRSGERLRRLEQGHRHAEKALLEKILRPALGSLEHLHPEYEAHHFNGRKYFLDIALVHWPLPANEADDFASHVTGMDRGKCSAEKRRDTQLQLAGWRIVRILYDDIVDQPAQWRQLEQSAAAINAKKAANRPSGRSAAVRQTV